MLNNLEFCCDTLRQNGAVDQDSLFCIFSGGRSCYYFCNCAAFKGSLAMASISQKKCLLIHPRVSYFAQAVRFSNCVVHKQFRGKVPREECASKQTKNKPNKQTQFFHKSKFVFCSSAVYYGLTVSNEY